MKVILILLFAGVLAFGESVDFPAWQQGNLLVKTSSINSGAKISALWEEDDVIMRGRGVTILFVHYKVRRFDGTYDDKFITKNISVYYTGGFSYAYLYVKPEMKDDVIVHIHGVAAMEISGHKKETWRFDDYDTQPLGLSWIQLFGFGSLWRNEK